MKSFKWCVWLIPDKNHHWNSLTNGFPVHMTVKSFLEKEEAESFLTENFDPVYLKIASNPIAEYDEDFSALYYRVESARNWFPENPHVSFYYSYEQSLKMVEAKGGALFDQMVIANCQNHFRNWTYETLLH